MVKFNGTTNEMIHDELEYVQSWLLDQRPYSNGEQHHIRVSSEVLLYKASSLALTDILETLLPHIDTIVNNDYYRSKLLYDCVRIAHEKKHNDMVRILLEFAASKPTLTTSDISEAVKLLHYAAVMGDVNSVRLLINIGIDVNKANSVGETALHFASDAAIAEVLLSNGANPNVTNSEDKSPLYYACASYRLEVIRKLLENGAKTNFGLNFIPLDVACDWDKDSSIANALLQVSDNDLYGLDIVSCCWEAMFNDDELEFWERSFCKSCKNERQLVIQKIKAKKTDVDANSQESTHGYTPLHLAILEHSKTKRDRGVVEIDEIKHLLLKSNSTIVNALDTSGATALYYAVENNLIEIASLLLDSGADPNLTSSNKYTLTVACSYLSHDFVKLLLKKGADPNVFDTSDESPLNIAAKSFDYHLVKLLVEHGADVNYQDQRGVTALHSIANPVTKPACRSSEVESFEIAKLLIDGGLNINHVDDEGDSILSYVTYWIVQVERTHYQLFELLLEREADVNFFNPYNNTVTQYPFVITEYLRRGGDPNQPDKQGRNLLAIACKSSNERCSRILLAAGADINMVTWDTLVCASEENNIQIMDLLLNKGVKFDVTNDTLMCVAEPPEVITFSEFYIPFCLETECIVRLFKAGSNLKILSTCCRSKCSNSTPLELDCSKAGRLCQALVLAGYSIQQKEELVELLRESEKPHAHNLCSWLDEDSMNPPSLLRLARTVIRRQLSVSSGYQTILPLIDLLPLSNLLQLYLKFEGPYSEIDLSEGNVVCDFCRYMDTPYNNLYESADVEDSAADNGSLLEEEALSDVPDDDLADEPNDGSID